MAISSACPETSTCIFTASNPSAMIFLLCMTRDPTGVSPFAKAILAKAIALLM